MRGKNDVKSARAQLSLSENTDRILQEVATKLEILGKTKAEVANRIVTDWIWSNEERLARHGVALTTRTRRKK